MSLSDVGSLFRSSGFQAVLVRAPPEQDSSLMSIPNVFITDGQSSNSCEDVMKY
jgi:hypothetical protein